MSQVLFNLLLVVVVFLVLNFGWKVLQKFVRRSTTGVGTKPVKLKIRNKEGNPESLYRIAYVLDSLYGWCELYEVTMDSGEKMYVLLSKFGEQSFYTKKLVWDTKDGVWAIKPPEFHPQHHLVIE